jgi:V8-like Glu-specific endopeptidase
MRKLMIMCSVLAAGALAVTGPAAAQSEPPGQDDVKVEIDSGWVQNQTRQRGVIYSTAVVVPDASWLRLHFDDVTLGSFHGKGRPTILRLTSLLDGAVQKMTSLHLEQWQNSSAYFNGDGVLLEIVADPSAAPSRVQLTDVAAGVVDLHVTESICGIVDDRTLSGDPRVARRFPSGCTAWLIDDPNHCFLTAGHCASAMTVVEFNVPLSSATGAPLHPGPEDQYVVDATSMQTNGGAGVGNDWAYFGCFPNTNTGLTPYEAQGDYFNLATSIPTAPGTSVRVTGFGTVTSPVPDTWNWAQKTHVGPLVYSAGTLVEYQADTTGGNSGSPVIDEATGLAIAIHTHGGCGSGGNNGTSVLHGGLQFALANPQGVCALNPCYEDLDQSGDVGFRDILLLIGAWGPCGSCPADLDHNGVVDLGDVFELIMAWGPCS